MILPIVWALFGMIGLAVAYDTDAHVPLTAVLGIALLMLMLLTSFAKVASKSCGKTYGIDRVIYSNLFCEIKE